MTQEEAKRYWHGWWWRPEQPSERWSGTLTFSRDHGAILNAFASWPEEPGAAGPPDREVPWAPVIHGETVDGKAITLLSCPLWDGTQYGMDRMEMEWRPETVVVGSQHYATRHELVADHVTLAIDELLEWLREPWFDGPPVFHDTWPWRSPHRRRRPAARRRSHAAQRRRSDARRRRINNIRHLRELQARRRAPALDEPTRIRVGDVVMRIGFYDQRSFSWLRGDRISRTASVQMTSSRPMSVDDWHDRFIHPLNQLLILLRGAPVAVASTAFGMNANWRSDFEILPRRWPPADAPRGRSASFMPLPRAAVGRHLERLVNEWFRLQRRLEPALGIFIGTLVGQQWVNNQLLNLTSFIETYHEREHNRLPVNLDEYRRIRRHFLKSLSGPMKDVFAQKLGYAERLPQEDRLADVVRRAQRLLMELDPLADELIRQATATRNHLAHWGRIGPDVVTDDRDLARLNDRLVAVIYANLLQDLRLEPDAVRHALARRYARSPVLDPSLEIRFDEP